VTIPFFFSLGMFKVLGQFHLCKQYQGFSDRLCANNNEPQIYRLLLSQRRRDGRLAIYIKRKGTSSVPASSRGWS
jgi:hypothetical protein